MEFEVKAIGNKLDEGGPNRTKFCAYQLTIKGDFLVGQQVEHLVVHDVGLLVAALPLAERGHHVGGRLAGVRAGRLVRAALVRRAQPRAADARVATSRQPAQYTQSSHTIPILLNSCFLALHT